MKEKIGYYKNSSLFDEAIRSVRTNIEFSDVDNKNKIISITSSKPSEGKTTVVYNLAKSFARNGYKVVLVDCDLRMPKVKSVSGINENIGITNVITGKISLNEAILVDKEVKNLSILLSVQLLQTLQKYCHQIMRKTCFISYQKILIMYL